MRTVRLGLLEKDLQFLHNMARTLTRNYKFVCLNRIITFNVLTDIKISLLKKAETIWIRCCIFQDYMEFREVLDCCQNANEFFLYQICFDNINSIPDEKLKYKENNERVRPVKCTIERTDWRVLQCFENIYELNVIQIPFHIPSVKEKLFLFENYAHTIKSINLNEWTNDELLLLSKKGQLRSIKSVKIYDENFLKFVLDDICQHLHNLETFKCKIVNLNYVNFNKLKKLRSLSLTTRGKLWENNIFELDITELTLIELTLRTKRSMNLKISKKFSQPPMTSMKRLQLYDFNIDQEARNAIASLMPNLEYLYLYFKVSLYLFVSILCLFVIYFK
jgi:hypothetical protein